MMNNDVDTTNTYDDVVGFAASQTDMAELQTRMERMALLMSMQTAINTMGRGTPTLSQPHS